MSRCEENINKMAAATTWFLFALFFPLIFAQVKIMPLGDSTTAIVGFLPKNSSPYYC
jgi:hypothetical protein